MKNKFIIISILVILISGCVSTPVSDSSIWVSVLPGQITRYYIPATTWQEKTNRFITCRIDMTYLDEPGRQVVCNISFFNRNSQPNEVNSLSFSAFDGNYSLNNVNTMFTRAEHNEL